MNSDHQNNNRGKGGGNNRRNVTAIVSIILWALVLTVLVNYATSMFRQAYSVEISYGTFRELVKQDCVEGVVMTSTKYTIYLKDGVSVDAEGNITKTATAAGLTNCEGRTIKSIHDVKLGHADKWIISRLQATIRDVTLALNKLELGIACQTAYDFMWYDFCDWYIELTKSALWSDDEAKKDTALAVLVYVLDSALKLLHPFVPFVTEKIYSELPGASGRIMLAAYPRYNSRLTYRKEAQAFAGVMDIIKEVRALKTETGCAPSKKVTLYLITDSKRLISANEDCILRLAGASEIKFVTSPEAAGENAAAKVVSCATLLVPMGDLVDSAKERERLEGELEKVMAEIRRADGKLHNNGFVSKAPKKLVDEERAKLEKYIEMKERIEKQLKSL